jgi:hypothetical protein
MTGHEIRTLKFMTRSRRGTDPSRTLALSWRRSFRPLSSSRNESAAINRQAGHRLCGGSRPYGISPASFLRRDTTPLAAGPRLPGHQRLYWLQFRRGKT